MSQSDLEALRDTVVLLTVPAAAEQISISTLQLHREIAAGTGPVTVVIGKRTMIAQDDLFVWLNQRRRRASVQPSVSVGAA
jgi:hypothetical protein